MNIKNLDLLLSSNDRKKIELILNATKKSKSKRIEQGFRFGTKKQQIYDIGFEDAIEWLLSNESDLDSN